jgi:uncharacterized protein YabE (DUF348 family)
MYRPLLSSLHFFRRKYRPIGIGIFVFLIGLGIVWQVKQASKPRITIDVNGDVREIRSDSHTVKDVLDEAGIPVDTADKVYPPLDTVVDSDTTITIYKAYQLVLEVDGQLSKLYTHVTDPLQVLAENGIYLNTEDQLYVNHQHFDPEKDVWTKQIPPTHLRVIHAKRYTIYDGEQIYEGISAAPRVGDVIYENNLRLYLADKIVPSVETALVDGLKITISRSQPVYIRIDGRDLYTRAVGATINDVLNMLGLPLTGQDYSIPPEADSFVSDMRIEVVRVVETLEIHEEAIPFQTLTTLDPELSIDEERIIQLGAPGIRASRIRIRTENGLEVSRTIQETWTVTEPLPQIVAYGTRPHTNQDTPQ